MPHRSRLRSTQVRRNTGATLLIIIVGAASTVSGCHAPEDETQTEHAAPADTEDSIPRVTTAKMLPYAPEERGKFLEVCLERPLARSERYGLKLDFTTTAATRLECQTTLAPPLSGLSVPCHRINVFCSDRFTSAAERLVMERDVNGGMVSELTAAIGRTYEPAVTTTYVFKDL